MPISKIKEEPSFGVFHFFAEIIFAMDLIFASHNDHKCREIRALLPDAHVSSLKDLNFTDEIPETGTTLEANAAIKAQRIYDEFGKAVFADDTGLIVPSLNNEPGVYSARYAGENANAESNMAKLLANLEQQADRSAYFETVICFINAKGEQHFFRGRVDGEILMHKHGEEGFGYDPIFKPKEGNRSFAQMSSIEKNRISHRGRALAAFIQFLQSTEKN